MNAIIENQMSQVAHAGNSRSLVRFGAAAGLIFGTILMVSGAVLSVLAFLEEISFDGTELIMIVSAFVLLGLGAHCLDILERDKKMRRQSRHARGN